MLPHRPITRPMRKTRQDALSKAAITRGVDWCLVLKKMMGFIPTFGNPLVIDAGPTVIPW